MAVHMHHRTPPKRDTGVGELEHERVCVCGLFVAICLADSSKLVSPLLLLCLQGGAVLLTAIYAKQRGLLRRRWECQHRRTSRASPASSIGTCSGSHDPLCRLRCSERSVGARLSTGAPHETTFALGSRSICNGGKRHRQHLPSCFKVVQPIVTGGIRDISPPSAADSISHLQPNSSAATAPARTGRSSCSIAITSKTWWHYCCYFQAQSVGAECNRLC